MLTGHGRATPLMWRTVRSSTLKGQMKRYEKELLERLREVVPSQVKVTVVADRGFGDCKAVQDDPAAGVGICVCDPYSG